MKGGRELEVRERVCGCVLVMEFDVLRKVSSCDFSAITPVPFCPLPSVMRDFHERMRGGGAGLICFHLSVGECED